MPVRPGFRRPVSLGRRPFRPPRPAVSSQVAVSCAAWRLLSQVLREPPRSGGEPLLPGRAWPLLLPSSCPPPRPPPPTLQTPGGLPSTGLAGGACPSLPPRTGRPWQAAELWAPSMLPGGMAEPRQTPGPPSRGPLLLEELSGLPGGRQTQGQAARPGRRWDSEPAYRPWAARSSCLVTAHRRPER